MKRHLVWIIVIALATGAGLFLRAADPGQPAPAPETAVGEDQDGAKPPANPLAGVPDVLATWDQDNKITKEDLMQELGPQLPMAMQYWGTVSAEERDQQLRQVIQGMVYSRLLRQMAATAGITADSKEVKQRLADLREQIGEERYAQGLQQSGITEEKLLEDLTIQAWVEEKVLPEVKVPMPEQMRYYEANKGELQRVRASHVLAKVDADAEPEKQQAAKEKIEKAKAQIAQGKDFAEVARALSDCPSAQRGGDLDWFTRGRMVPEFETAAFGLEKGQVSDVIKTDFGYHIIKVTDREATFEDVQEQVEQQLQGERVQAELMERLDKSAEQHHLNIAVGKDQPAPPME